MERGTILFTESIICGFIECVATFTEISFSDIHIVSTSITGRILFSTITTGFCWPCARATCARATCARATTSKEKAHNKQWQYQSNYLFHLLLSSSVCHLSDEDASHSTRNIGNNIQRVAYSSRINQRENIFPQNATGEHDNYCNSICIYYPSTIFAVCQSKIHICNKTHSTQEIISMTFQKIWNKWISNNFFQI